MGLRLVGSPPALFAHQHSRQGAPGRLVVYIASAVRKLFHLVLLAGLWGPSFLFIRVAVHEVPPITLVAGRMVLAAAMLWVVLRMRGGSLSRDRKVWAHSAVLALFGTALPFVLVSWGELYIDSALAAILHSTVPFFPLLLAHFWTRDDRLDRRKSVGVVLGMIGVVVLIAPTMGAGLESDTIGLLAVTGASLCYGFAGVYARQYLRGLPSLVAPTILFLLSAVLLVPLSLVVDRPWTLPLPSNAALGSWFGLVLLGTVLAYIVYYRMLEFATASYISMVTYLIPVIATVLGVTIAHEVLHWNAYVGFTAILLGVLVVNRLARAQPVRSD